MVRIHIRKHIPQTTRWWGIKASRGFTGKHYYLNIGFGKYFLAFRSSPMPKHGSGYRFFDWNRD